MEHYNELNVNELERVTGGAGSDFEDEKLLILTAIHRLENTFREYCATLGRREHEREVKTALNELDLTEDDVKAVRDMEGFRFADTHWGNFKLVIRGMGALQFFTDPNFLLIESKLVVD